MVGINSATLLESVPDASVKYLPAKSVPISPTPARLINPPLPVSPLPSDIGWPVAGLIDASALGAVKFPYSSLA